MSASCTLGNVEVVINNNSTVKVFVADMTGNRRFINLTETDAGNLKSCLNKLPEIKTQSPKGR